MLINYDTIKLQAKQRGLTIDDLCALAPLNDPFFVGRDSQTQAAEWFADLWGRFGYGHGVHLRRMHYQIVSQAAPVIRPDGQPYHNTFKSWTFLNDASKWARYLGLVSSDAFVDRRNPDPVIKAIWTDDSESEPDYEVWGGWQTYGYELPTLPELPDLPEQLPDLPDFNVTGYLGIQQSYHIEIWAEKTTMNDVLLPLCQRYRANLITGAGEMSTTSANEFMRRVRAANRPGRILYISDFDPAGLGMPISVARKIEFYQRNEGYDDLDIKLQPIVLTAEQVSRYTLPRVPVKDSDRRKGHFEAAHGEGQVELDALEALYPGTLAQIVTEQILNYYDPTLPDRARQAKWELMDLLDAERDEILSTYEDDLNSLAAEYAEIRADFDQTRQEFSDLIADFQPKIDAHRARLDRLLERGAETYSILYSHLDRVDVPMPDLPEPELPAESDEQLYDSGRDYFSQLAAYKVQRNGHE
jgi:hypothetical protein